MTESASFDSKAFLTTLPNLPGIYQMLGKEGEVLYVGKAKNLKSRVSSYFSGSGLTTKTLALVARINSINITITKTETEALLLEQNLIKQIMPPYNILLRDDKSYPYIFLSDGEFPRLAYHRGSKREKGSYFGPYPNGTSVRETLALLQRVFKVRQCEDSYFANRSRPCLQYQIKRCTAPCVNLVTPDQYAEQVQESRLLLQGKSNELRNEIASKMEVAAQELRYEIAADYRDKLQHLQKICESQYVEAGVGNCDIVGMALQRQKCCVHILYIRNGQMIGSNSYYLDVPLEDGEEVVLEAFLAGFYLLNEGREIPGRIVCPQEFDFFSTLVESLSERAQIKVELIAPRRGRLGSWMEMAMQTAGQNLKSRLVKADNLLFMFEELRQVLQLEELPQRIECFDISHSSGEATVASCVVFTQQGSANSDYRQFNITDITPGDDYAAMEQALTRRFRRLAEGEGKRPDVLLIDGGIGQVIQARTVLQDCGIQDVVIVGVAKGETRKPGFETLVFATGEHSIVLPADSQALHLIQQVRDEAHRFAVQGHIRRRDNTRRKSSLEDIPGVGAKRRKELLRYFGSVKAVREAPIRELLKVPMINQKIAEDIYAAFHKDSLE